VASGLLATSDGKLAHTQARSWLAKLAHTKPVRPR
jgi:hypothetical protein